MSKTQFIHGQELKEKLLQGIKKLNTAVSSTLGPGGRTVLIKEESGEIKVTKDGVSVAKSFSELEDPIESIGANIVKQVSIKSANEAGDGTTTSTLIASTIVEEGLKYIRQGVNAVWVKNRLDELVKEIELSIREKSTDIVDEKEIKQVATISGNNDEEVGNLIATALEKVGREGVVTIEESKTGETTLEVVEGLQFDRGYKSPYFTTNTANMQCVLSGDPYVLIVDGKINSAQELVVTLTKANAESKPVLIVAEDFGDEALATLIVNKMRGIVSVSAVRAPDFGERRSLLLEDMAIITGGQVISKDKGVKLEKLNTTQISEYLGKARLVTVTKEQTTIVDGHGDSEKIAARAEEIKQQLDSATTAFEKEKLQERLGKLVGGVALVSVGGNSEIEMREKKDRVEDALFATQAALDEGIVPGGGLTLLKQSIALKNKEAATISDIAELILEKALEAPFKTILINSGREDWYNYIPKSEDEVYDAKSGKFVNFREAGIIDPTKVVLTALKNAVSVAGTVLTTESVIFEKKEKGEQTQPDFPMM